MKPGIAIAFFFFFFDVDKLDKLDKPSLKSLKSLKFGNFGNLSASTFPKDINDDDNWSPSTEFRVVLTHPQMCKWMSQFCNACQNEASFKFFAMGLKLCMLQGCCSGTIFNQLTSGTFP